MALKEEKVFDISGKKKGQCSKGDQSSFRHETQDSAQKPEHTAATLSEPAPARCRSVSRKRSIRGKGRHGSILRHPCRYYLKSTTRTPCEYWHPPECQFYKTKTGFKSGDTCLFPHYEVADQPNKKPKKGYFPKRRESEDKGAVAIVKSVSQLGCVSQDSDALVSQDRSLGETRCRKSWDRFEEIDSPSLRCVTRVSGKRKDHRMEKYKSKILINEVPTLRNLRASPMKRLKDKSNAPEARRGILSKKYLQAQRKEKATFYSPSEEWVLPAASTKEPEER